jgi:hypothetical protein
VTRRQTESGGVESFRGFPFDCEITVAVNPLTKTEVQLTPPVKIKCFEDFARFYDKWDEFCKDLGGHPTEVAFTLEDR